MSITNARPQKWTWHPELGLILPNPRNFFPLWEKSGATISDIVSGATATVSTGVTWAAAGSSDPYGAHTGGGLVFSGTGYITLPKLPVDGDCTITFGFSATSVSTNQCILALGVANSDCIFASLYASHLEIGVNAGSGAEFTVDLTGHSGDWYDFIVVKTFQAGVYCYYSINGGSWTRVLQDTNGPYGNPTADSFFIGNGPAYANFTGTFGYLGIYQAQVAAGKLAALEADPFADLRGNPTSFAIGEFQIADNYDLDPTVGGGPFVQCYAESVIPNNDGATPGNIYTGGICAYNGQQIVFAVDKWSDANVPCSTRLLTSADKGVTWSEVLPSANYFNVNTSANAVPAIAVSSTDPTTATITIENVGSNTNVTLVDSNGTHTLGPFAWGSATGTSIHDLCTAINAVSRWTATAQTSQWSSTFASANTGAQISFLVPVTTVNCKGAGATLNVYLGYDGGGCVLDPGSGTLLFYCTQWVDNNTAMLSGSFGTPPYAAADWTPMFQISGAPMVGGTPGTGGDQHWPADNASAIHLADGRWMIATHMYSERGGESTTSGVLVSALGATLAQLQAGANDSAAPQWSYQQIIKGTNGFTGIETALAQLANGQIVAVGRTDTFAVMSVGTIGAGGAITWADPTDSTNAYPYCTCDGGQNSGNGMRRPLIYSGTSPVKLLAVNSASPPLLYLITGEPPYGLTAYSQPGTTAVNTSASRGQVTVSQILQTDITSMTAGIFVRKSPYGTVLNGNYNCFGPYSQWAADGATLIGQIGQYFLRGPENALSTASGGGGGNVPNSLFTVGQSPAINFQDPGAI